jgi:tRNA pseudouridine32 synthase/23S rRNA pseudouridine746 synthase
MRLGVSASVVAVPAGASANTSVLDFLVTRMPGISRQEWAERLQQGLVLHDNGQAAAPEQVCQPGQRLHYYRHLADEPTLPVQARVLFEDDHLLVADKPHFMPVTPSGPYVQQSLLVQLKRLTGCADLVPLHRIDRETAGLVLFPTQSPLGGPTCNGLACTPAAWCRVSLFSEPKRCQEPPTAKPASSCSRKKAHGACTNWSQ